MLRSSKNFKNRSEILFSSCISRIISSRPILSAVQAERRPPWPNATQPLSQAPLLQQNHLRRPARCSFFPSCGYNCDFRAALLKIKNRVCRISLRKEGILGRQFDDCSAEACPRQEGGGRKVRQRGNVADAQLSIVDRSSANTESRLVLRASCQIPSILTLNTSATCRGIRLEATAHYSESCHGRYEDRGGHHPSQKTGSLVMIFGFELCGQHIGY